MLVYGAGCSMLTHSVMGSDLTGIPVITLEILQDQLIICDKNYYKNPSKVFSHIAVLRKVKQSKK